MIHSLTSQFLTRVEYNAYACKEIKISCINFIFINAFLRHVSSPTPLPCRYIAVTKPIKYAKHKNSRRVCLTILLVWAISAAIGSPIVLGLNNTPDRVPDLCVFYNSDFIVYSSLSSFYIPCIIMVFLYWNIFKVSSCCACWSMKVLIGMLSQ